MCSRHIGMGKCGEDKQEEEDALVLEVKLNKRVAVKAETVKSSKCVAI